MSSPDLETKDGWILQIGDVRVFPPVILAPLAGITDYPFRVICRRWGAGLAVSEMVASQAVVRRNRKTLRMIETAQEECPLSVQIFGSDPVVMAEAARICCDTGAAIIDINMGCPQKKIVKTGAGAALMRSPDLAARIVEAVRKAIPDEVGVTVKMRLGWHEEELSAHVLAKMVEEAGAEAVAVHARTKAQMFGGEARWKLVKRVCDAVSVPVVVNGDIVDVPSLARALDMSGAQGAMIGRGALGCPWIFGQLKAFAEGAPIPSPPSPEELAELALEHCRMLAEFYGMPTGLWMARKHLAWYSKGRLGGAAFRKEVFQASSMRGLASLARSFFLNA